MADKAFIPNFDDIIARYEGGESINKLAPVAGVTRRTLTLHLKECGVKIRGRSEAEKLKWASGAVDIERQLGKAWEACRGRVYPRSGTVKSARRHMARGNHIHPFEAEVADALIARGYEAVQQFAVEAYNIDVAIPPRVAVEVIRQTVHRRYSAAHYKRTKHLLDRGWWVLFVHIPRNRVSISFDAEKVADEVVNLSRPRQRGPCRAR